MSAAADLHHVVAGVLQTKRHSPSVGSRSFDPYPFRSEPREPVHEPVVNRRRVLSIDSAELPSLLVDYRYRQPLCESIPVTARPLLPRSTTMGQAVRTRASAPSVELLSSDIARRWLPEWTLKLKAHPGDGHIVAGTAQTRPMGVIRRVVHRGGRRTGAMGPRFHGFRLVFSLPFGG
jgi:hypothetical protein